MILREAGLWITVHSRNVLNSLTLSEQEQSLCRRATGRFMVLLSVVWQVW